MPMYDLRCNKCGRVNKDVFFKSLSELDYRCKKCKNDTFTPLVPKRSKK